MLSDSQIATFEEEGCLVIEDLFTEEDLRPVKDEFNTVVEGEARRLYEAGRIGALYEDEPFERRLAKVAAEAPEAAAALQTRTHKGEALFQFMKHPKILDRVESLVGPDILCHPSYNIHPRLPDGYTSSHQDAGYYLPDGDETLILACLIPLVDTTLENGCLWVARRRHKEGVFHHFSGEGGLNLLLEDVPESERIPLPTKAGSMVMFSSMLPHGSLVNRTDTIRWSMDLRYQALDQPTGRWYVPGFVARSRSHPELETPNCAAWVAEVERVGREAEQYPERPRSRWTQS
ncbi:MAG: phytanoyl-CoA dioxygenase family protein [Candidatus Poribacteria bacterium]|nr:phytanoyl-CoA dioxygenase family protein [Candidatus Poribacteria bacterium]